MLQTSYSVDTRAMRLHCIRIRNGTVLLRRRSDVREIGGKFVWNSSNFVLWFGKHIPQSRSGFFHRYAPKNRKALHRLPLREEHDHHIGVKTLISSVWLRMLQLSLCVLKINSWKNILSKIVQNVSINTYIRVIYNTECMIFEIWDFVRFVLCDLCQKKICQVSNFFAHKISEEHAELLLLWKNTLCQKSSKMSKIHNFYVILYHIMNVFWILVFCKICAWRSLSEKIYQVSNFFAHTISEEHAELLLLWKNTLCQNRPKMSINSRFYVIYTI